MTNDIKFTIVMGFLEASMIDVYWPEGVGCRDVNIIRADTYYWPIYTVQPWVAVARSPMYMG